MDPRVVCSISSSPDIQDNSLSSVESGSWRSCQSLTQRTVNSTDEAELQGQSQTNTNSVRVLSEGESYLPTLFHQIIRRKGNDSDNYIIRYFPHLPKGRPRKCLTLTMKGERLTDPSCLPSQVMIINLGQRGTHWL